ncbi:MAG TPA: aminoglycoside phosphotransferase family protein, partial [Acidobacteriota bacterium]
MLEKPDIKDEFIISQLQEEYGLRIEQFNFIPIGADLNAAVYRVAANEGTVYFLKLRKGFDEI